MCIRDRDTVWLNSTAVGCIAPGGFTSNAQVTVVVGGMQYTPATIAYKSIGVVTGSDPATLPHEGVSDLTLFAPGVVEALQYFGTDIHIALPTLAPPSAPIAPAMVGPWILNASDTSFSPSTGSISGFILPPGLGGNFSGIICLTHIPTQQWQCTSPTPGWAALSFTPPTLLSISPNINVPPLGGTFMTITASSIGSVSSLAPLSARDGVTYGFTNEGDVTSVVTVIFGEERIDNVVLLSTVPSYTFQFQNPPPTTGVVDVFLDLFGAVSNPLPVAFAQTYVTSVAPRNVIPSLNGARKYDFFVGGVGFEKVQVKGVNIGGINCLQFKPVSYTHLTLPTKRIE